MVNFRLSLCNTITFLFFSHYMYIPIFWLNCSFFFCIIHELSSLKLVDLFISYPVERSLYANDLGHCYSFIFCFVYRVCSSFNRAHSSYLPSATENDPMDVWKPSFDSYTHCSSFFCFCFLNKILSLLYKSMKPYYIVMKLLFVLQICARSFISLFDFFSLQKKIYINGYWEDIRSIKQISFFLEKIQSICFMDSDEVEIRNDTETKWAMQLDRYWLWNLELYFSHADTIGTG